MANREYKVVLKDAKRIEIYDIIRAVVPGMSGKSDRDVESFIDDKMERDFMEYMNSLRTRNVSRDVDRYKSSDLLVKE